MLVCRPVFQIALVAGIILLGSTRVAANEATPFSPQAPAAAKPSQSKRVPPTLEKLEFNGFMKLGNRVSLSFYDHVNAQNHWISLNETKGGFLVDEFDAQQKHVRVSYQGFSRFIYLSKEQITELKQVTPPIPDIEKEGALATVEIRDAQTIEEENEAADMLGMHMAVSYELQKQHREEVAKTRRAEAARRAARHDRRRR